MLGQALAQSSAIFLCAADKQNKMRARKNSGASICVFIYKFGARSTYLSLCACVCKKERVG